MSQADSYPGEAQDIALILIDALTRGDSHRLPNGDQCGHPLTRNVGQGTASCDFCGYYNDPFEGLEA